MTDLIDSPAAEPHGRPGRRWKIVLTVLVLVALAATWQQGLLEDGLNELRRQDAAAALPPPTEESVGTAAALDFSDIPAFLRSSQSADPNVDASVPSDFDPSQSTDFDPWTAPTQSGIDLDRLRHAAENLDTDQLCPRSPPPATEHDVVEILQFLDGCLLIDHEALAGRSIQQVRDEYSDDISVLAVDRPSAAIPLQSSVDPQSSNQWHLAAVDAAALQAGWPLGATVTVAVLDTGVDSSHIDLDDSLTDLNEAVIDLPFEYYGPGNGRVDLGSHGTHVAGIIAAEANNGHSGMGVAPSASILPVTVIGSLNTDCSRADNSLSVSEGIASVIGKDVDIISMSLFLLDSEADCTSGEKFNADDPSQLFVDDEDTVSPFYSSDPNQTVEAVIRVAQMRGIIVVASAGNCGKKGWWIFSTFKAACHEPNQRQYPAAFPGVVAVAATTKSGDRAWFSTAADHVDISAPGEAILSTVPGNKMETMSGTSQATPIVSAILAHLIARFPIDRFEDSAAGYVDYAAHAKELVDALYSTAEKPDDQDRTKEFGFGKVRPLEAIALLESQVADSDDVPIDFRDIEKETGEIPVILVADTSGSMGDQVDGDMKLDVAKASLLKFLSTTNPTRPIALRTYPARNMGECNSGELRIDFAPRRVEVEAVVLGLQADGDTPTAEALVAAVEDIRAAGFSQAEIALFSDGLATCADPCQAAQDIAASGVDIRVHVGAFVDSVEGRDKLKCIARETEGSYMEGSNVESAFGTELDEFLERNSKPLLEVTFELPDRVFPSTDSLGEFQQAEAVVRNDSNVAAKGVVVVLETAGESGPTRHPVSVGNMAPGAESTVSWPLHPGFENVGTVLDVELIATAANTGEVASSTGAVAVEDPNVADDAGPILGVGQIVVMGDQLLSGVGTSTRGSYGGCRRSREIGLLEVFGQRAERSVACANALIAHLAAPDWAKDVDSQVKQLADLAEGGGAVNAVILSIGATDFGLSELVRRCVLSAVACDSEVSGIPTEVWLGESIASGGPRHVAASGELVRALGAIDQALNATRDQSRRARQVPILLLAQPRTFPFVHGACFERWQGEDRPLMTQPELNLYHHFVSAVNGTLEAAAVAAQELGLPVFYVDTTESAYLPDHTACSAEPYVQSLEPLAEAGPGVIKTLSGGGIAGVAGLEFNQDALVELGEEFLAPNEYGEQALANAVLRWSQSDEAQEADDFVTDEFQRRSAGVAPRISEPTPGETRPLGRAGRLAVEPGRGWTASASGFLPGALVTASVLPGGGVVASAVADENGTAELFVAVPRDVAAGDVTLVASGLSRSGEAISVEQPVRVLPPLRPVHSVALPALAVLLLFGSLCLWMAYRRKAIPSAPSPDENQ